MPGEKNKLPTQNRWCRSAICGSEPFIPDSEFTGDDCKLTCSVKKEEHK